MKKSQRNKTMEDKYKHQKKYRAKAVKQIVFDLNKETDADIIEHLETVSNRTGYLKALIRANMKKESN